MKILIADSLTEENQDFSIGWELFYVYNQELKVPCYIAGKNCPIHEQDIERIAEDFDLIIITESDPVKSNWEWWEWHNVDTPKIYWQTVAQSQISWIKSSGFNKIALSHKQFVAEYYGYDRFYLPLGVFRSRYGFTSKGQGIGLLDDSVKRYDLLDFIKEYDKFVVRDSPGKYTKQILAIMGAGKVPLVKDDPSVYDFVPSEFLWRDDSGLENLVSSSVSLKMPDFWDRFCLSKRAEFFLRLGNN